MSLFQPQAEVEDFAAIATASRPKPTSAQPGKCVRSQFLCGRMSVVYQIFKVVEESWIVRFVDVIVVPETRKTHFLSVGV